VGGQMKFLETPLRGAYVIDVDPFVDERGFFARTFCKNEFSKIGFNGQILQINHSMTKQKGTIRGMHYQIPPASETKILRCLQGEIFDVMVDLRIGSPTFMQWHAVELSKENMRTVFIPEGFAHGFQALTDDIELIYLHSEFYQPDYEKGLMYNDPVLAINWPLPPTDLSSRDKQYPLITPLHTGILL
jgi:dTDP-4-dehydrorhamnose 3,5-epimerase